MADLLIENFAVGGVAFPVLLAVLNIIVRIVFSVGVYLDSNDRSTVLVPGVFWTLATLAGGVFVAVAYWLVHHSVLGHRDFRES